MEQVPVPMRERTRRAVRTELVAVAQALFAERGYDQVTIEEIAQAAGMSRRTFFRYFASKDEVMLAKHELLADLLTEALAARPVEEGLWESFRRAFDAVVPYFDDPAYTAQVLSTEQIINANPALIAGQFERMWRLQEAWLPIVRERTGENDPADPRHAVWIGAAIAAFMAAKTTWIESGQARPFAHILDQAMNTLNPG